MRLEPRLPYPTCSQSSVGLSKQTTTTADRLCKHHHEKLKHVNETIMQAVKKKKIRQNHMQQRTN